MASPERHQDAYVPPTFAELRGNDTRQEAFTRWFQHDHGSATNFALRFTRGDAEAAADLAAEAWTATYRVLSSSPHEGAENANPRTYLYTTIHNHAINRARRARRRVQEEPLEAEIGEDKYVPSRYLNSGEDVSSAVVEKVHGEKVTKKLGEVLIPDQALLLQLEAEDYNGREKSEITGKPLATARTGLYRARARMQDRAAEVFEPESVLRYRQQLPKDNPHYLPADATIDDVLLPVEEVPEPKAVEASPPAEPHPLPQRSVVHEERMNKIATLWSGHTRKEISEKLGIDPATVSRYAAELRRRGMDLELKHKPRTSREKDPGIINQKASEEVIRRYIPEDDLSVGDPRETTIYARYGLEDDPQAEVQQPSPRRTPEVHEVEE